MGTESKADQVRSTALTRRIFAWLGLVAVIAGGVVSSNMFGVRDHLFGSAVPEAISPAAGRDAFAQTATARLAPTALRSAPWWQVVAILTGSGSSTSSSFAIGRDALQWRVKATCKSGQLLVRAPGQSKPLVNLTCPSTTTGYETKTGPARVEVIAAAPWRLEVAQQIDAPLVEPPVPAMTASGTTRAAVGSFYNIDQTGTGHVTFYRLTDGRFLMRLDHFFVSPNTDLQLLMSTLKAPHSSSQVSGASLKLVATMDVTAGSLNYVVPAGIDPTRFRSLVIWCPATASAYAAASLAPAR